MRCCGKATSSEDDEDEEEDGDDHDDYDYHDDFDDFYDHDVTSKLHWLQSPAD